MCCNLLKLLTFYILSDVNSLTGKVRTGRIMSSPGESYMRRPPFASLEGKFESGLTFLGGKSTAVWMPTKIRISITKGVQAVWGVYRQAIAKFSIITNLGNLAFSSVWQILRFFHVNNLAQFCMMSISLFLSASSGNNILGGLICSG